MVFDDPNRIVFSKLKNSFTTNNKQNIFNRRKIKKKSEERRGEECNNTNTNKIKFMFTLNVMICVDFILLFLLSIYFNKT
jgi:hypothetical protein